MSAQNKGAKAGEKVDVVSDKVKNTSWREVGATGGKKIDEVRTKVNEKYVDANGVTPEQHFKEIYGASANLIGNTYNYAWSWVPFTKQKAREAKEKAMHTDLATLKSDAKHKGLELKDDALTAELPGDTTQTIGGLVDESRALVGQILDTAIYYIKVAPAKAENAASDAKGAAKGAANDAKGTARDAQNRIAAKGNSYIDQARNLTAWVLERSQDIVTYGQQKAAEAKDAAEGKAGEVKDSAKSAANNFSAEAKANGGDRPGFTISAHA